MRHPTKIPPKTDRHSMRASELTSACFTPRPAARMARLIRVSPTAPPGLAWEPNTAHVVYWCLGSPSCGTLSPLETEAEKEKAMNNSNMLNFLRRKQFRENVRALQDRCHHLNFAKDPFGPPSSHY
ncbi:hypothetical protein V2G26_020344 [Clonostachys chloroleuca]